MVVFKQRSDVKFEIFVNITEFTCNSTSIHLIYHQERFVVQTDTTLVNFSKSKRYQSLYVEVVRISRSFVIHRFS